MKTESLGAWEPGCAGKSSSGAPSSMRNEKQISDEENDEPMSFAYLALFTGDYLKDTRHLSPQKHGVYLLLLIHCWDTKGPAPLDEQECAGITNCRSVEEVESLRYILNRYFIQMEDGWYNKRMQEEITKCQGLSRTFHDAGVKSGIKRRSKLRELKRKSKANLGSTKVKGRSVSSSSSSSLKALKPKPSSATDVAGDRGFAAFWNVYPRKKNKLAAHRAWLKIKPNATLGVIIVQAVEAAKLGGDWLRDGGAYIPHPATWLNAGGWEDELDPKGVKKPWEGAV